MLCLLVACSPRVCRANKFDTLQDRDDPSKASISSAEQEGTTPINELNGHPEPGSLLHVDHKPRLLLMGLKRYVMILHVDNHSQANQRRQEREVFDIERSIPQDGPSRDVVLRNNHDNS